VLGLADVEGPGGGSDGAGAAARGVALHALMETLDFAAPAVTLAAAATALAGEELGEDPAALAALAGAFARSPFCTRLAGAGDVRREQPFAFEADEVLVRGVLDAAVLEDDGTLLIVDYKSDRLADGEDLTARVERDYALQRIVYALAGLAGGAAAVEVAHCFLHRPEAMVAARYEACERAALEAQLARRIAPLRAGVFAVSSDPGRVRCGTCPARARLCSWEEPMTLRPQPSDELEVER
jgi:RecB family exonuclease